MNRWLPAASLALILASFLVGSGVARATEIDNKAAVLQGLDKVTAHVSRIIAPIGQPVRFGRLQIVARACRTHPPEETPEAAAFLEITEDQPGKPAKQVFSGWMFASSPALSAMEDPVYDISVVGCQ